MSAAKKRRRGPGGGGLGQAGKKFLTPLDLEFRGALRRHYRGFAIEPPANLPAELHASVRRALLELTDAGYFTYDVLQTTSTVSTTFVRRTLLGDAGQTYHYQGLRLFAHPWGPEAPKKSPLRVLKRLNDALRGLARPHMDEYKAATAVESSCAFNVTLINLMDPREPTLRSERDYGMGTTSVSWHSDSSLQTNSTIGVYHVTEGHDATWAVGLRCLGAAADAPAVRIPLPSQSSYVMVGQFNDTHHHAVMTGAAPRYSSTHRVSVVKADTIEYITAKRKAASAVLDGLLAAGTTAAAVDSRALHTLQETHTEVEFQWLRMYWLQGVRHDAQHAGWWAPRMAALEAWFFEVEAGLATLLDVLEAVTEARADGLVKRSFDILLYYLGDRQEQRRGHDERVGHAAYAKLEEADRPVDRPAFGAGSPLPRDLSSVLARIEGLKAAFLGASAGAGGGKATKKKAQTKKKKSKKKRKAGDVHT